MERRTRLNPLYQCVILLPVIALASAGLTACGQKGPLYQPPAEATSVTTPAPVADDAGASAPRKDAAGGKGDEPPANGVAPD